MRTRNRPPTEWTTLAVMVRSAEFSDLKACALLDTSFVTSAVWQMENQEREGEVAVVFRPVKLPRAMRVGYPRDHTHLLENWRRDECFLVAEEGGVVRGFIDMTVQTWHMTGWINNLVVTKRSRRRGIGSALLQAAMQWGYEKGLKQVIAETQTKNYPAICFYQKHGFILCGFNDHYYLNQDIALFFVQHLRT